MKKPWLNDYQQVMVFGVFCGTYAGFRDAEQVSFFTWDALIDAVYLTAIMFLVFAVMNFLYAYRDYRNTRDGSR
jgi:hypothetical protein